MQKGAMRELGHSWQELALEFVSSFARHGLLRTQRDGGSWKPFWATGSDLPPPPPRPYTRGGGGGGGAVWGFFRRGKFCTGNIPHPFQKIKGKIPHLLGLQSPKDTQHSKAAGNSSCDVQIVKELNSTPAFGW